MHIDACCRLPPPTPQSGDDSKKETFDGFAWVLRLRYIMENADNLTQVWCGVVRRVVCGVVWLDVV